jgi:L-malate glycosyltransferase
VVSSERLRILVLADSRSFHTERYVAELERQGCEVVTASLEEGHMPHHTLKRRGPFRALHYALAAVEVRSLIQSFAPDLLNPHFASGYGFLTALAERRGSLPILLHLWGSDILIAPHKSIFHWRKTRLALETADFVVGDSDYLLDKAAEIGEMRNRRTIVWGIERGFLLHRRGDAPFQAPLKILVPRVHEAVYNNLFVVRALAELVNGGKIELTFPDFGGQIGAFKANAGRLVKCGLKFYPKLPRDEYLRFAAQHDIYLSASLSDSSPASMLEAMGLGLIPVAGDIPGVREWLTPDSGFMFDLTQETVLRDVILHLLAPGADVTGMRAHNHCLIEQKALFESNIEETITIMRKLVAEKLA